MCRCVTSKTGTRTRCRTAGGGMAGPHPLLLELTIDHKDCLLGSTATQAVWTRTCATGRHRSATLTSEHDGVHLRRRRDVDEGAVGDDVVEAAALDLHPVPVLLAALRRSSSQR